MPANSTAVCNEALSFIGSQTQLASLNDPNYPGVAAAATLLYAPTVQLMLRELDPDFARVYLTLVTATGTPPPPWSYQYAYPSDCLRLRQVRPPGSGMGSLADANNPIPIKANVGVALVSSVLTKVIWTNQQNALAVYTTLNVTELMWDSVFNDAVVRRLANPFAMALAGRPDFARELLEESARVAGTAEMVDESSVRRLG